MGDLGRGRERDPSAEFSVESGLINIARSERREEVKEEEKVRVVRVVGDK